MHSTAPKTRTKLAEAATCKHCVNSISYIIVDLNEMIFEVRNAMTNEVILILSPNRHGHHEHRPAI